MLFRSPLDRGDLFGDAADDFAFEILDEFSAARVAPGGGVADAAAIAGAERVGEIGERICFGGVVICGIGLAFAAAGAGAESSDAELFHHVLVIFLRGPAGGVIGFAGGGRGSGGEREWRAEQEEKEQVSRGESDQGGCVS